MSDFLEKRLIKVVFDTAGTDSADVSNKTVAAHPSGVFIPDNAIITNAFYEVNTIMNSTADTATIAIMAKGANDLVSAIAINDGTNVWDAGIHGTLATAPNLGADGSHDTALKVIALYAALMVKIDGQEEITFTVGTQALLTGKLTLYIEYVIGE